MSTNKDQHLKWIDLVRVVAILAVIICHASETVYDVQDLYSMNSRIFIFACHAFGRMGVPLFMLVTGYLLLDRDYDEAAITKFWKKRWGNLLACTGIWFVIYEIFLWAIGKGTTDPIYVLQELTLTRRLDVSHAWYMGMILGVYILIPFVAIVLKKFNNKLFLFPFIIFYIYSFGNGTINGLLACSGSKYSMDNRFDLAFSGGIWGIYLVTGYFLKKGVLKKVSSLLLWTGLMASLIITFMYMLIPSFAGAVNSTYIWYDNVFVFFSSVLSFELLSRINKLEGFGYRVIRSVAKYSFPIYLTHNLFIILLYPYIETLNMRNSVKTILLFAIGLMIGYGVSWAITKIPKAGKYLTYVKD